MKKSILFLFALSIFTISVAQQPPAFLNDKVNGYVVLKNGKKLKGRFKVPGLATKSIKFESRNGDEKSFPSEDISYLMTKSSILKYILVGKIKKSGIKKFKNKSWMLVVNNGKKAKLYVQGTGYEVKKDGSIGSVVYGDKANSPSFSYYAQMIGRDEVPVWINSEIAFGKTINANAIFKLYAPKFFRDDAELSKKIKSKEDGYRHKDMERIFRDYNGN